MTATCRSARSWTPSAQILDREPVELRATYLPVVRDLVAEGFLEHP